MQTELLHVSARFHTALATAALKLEQQAACDEKLIPELTDADHRRRQRLLVNEQLLKAFRLREMLRQLLIRDDTTPFSRQIPLPR